MPSNKNSSFYKTSQPGSLCHRETSNIVSIYHRYLLGLAPPRGQDMMNSSVNRPKHNDTNNFDKRSFKMILAETDIENQIEIEIIEDVQAQNVNIWTDKIKELIKNSSYSKMGCISIINSIVFYEIKEKFCNHKDQNKALDEIISFKYDLYYFEKLQSNLRNIKQIRHLTITTYYEEIKKTINEIGRCKNWTEQEKKFFLKLDLLKT
ncbi:hypothetical protein DMUE_1332 [Dictyocoela muelleri]|nr:hypothetical protein DMUE_1332 [Dictyocoela muelleri]